MEWIFALGAIAFGLAFWSVKRDSLSNTAVLRPERRRVSLPMIIESPYEFPFSVLTYDLSLGGCFISLKDMNNSMVKPAILGKRSGLKIGKILRVHLQTGRFTSISLEAEVVRYELEENGKYPAGVGMQFLNLSKKNQRKLNFILFDRNQSAPATTKKVS